MFRSVVVLATLLVALESSSVEAQGRGGSWFGGGRRSVSNHSARRSHPWRGSWGAGRSLDHRDSGPRLYGSSLTIGIGIGSYPGYGHGYGYGYGYPGVGSLHPYAFDGYGYDPYRYGSFKAPDLLDDPYFRERYRYDSHFPGRYRAPLVMQPAYRDLPQPYHYSEPVQVEQYEGE
jgi:hypothetical protein